MSDMVGVYAEKFAEKNLTHVMKRSKLQQFIDKHPDCSFEKYGNIAIIMRKNPYHVDSIYDNFPELASSETTDWQPDDIEHTGDKF